MHLLLVLGDLVGGEKLGDVLVEKIVVEMIGFADRAVGVVVGEGALGVVEVFVDLVGVAGFVFGNLGIKKLFLDAVELILDRLLVGIGGVLQLELNELDVGVDVGGGIVGDVFFDGIERLLGAVEIGKRPQLNPG